MITKREKEIKSLRDKVSQLKNRVAELEASSPHWRILWIWLVKPARQTPETAFPPGADRQVAGLLEFAIDRERKRGFERGRGLY